MVPGGRGDYGKRAGNTRIFRRYFDGAQRLQDTSSCTAGPTQRSPLERQDVAGVRDGISWRNAGRRARCSMQLLRRSAQDVHIDDPPALVGRDGAGDAR